MARQSQGTDAWPTVLWIAWTAGETEHHEPLCYAHRDYVFEHYPASADGQGRRGDQCSMCLAQPPRTAQLLSPRDSTTASGAPEAVNSEDRSLILGVRGKHS